MVLELLYSSGLRGAEVLGMNVADLDLKTATALVRGKGSKERVVPIGATAMRFLESYLRAVRPGLLQQAEQPALFLDRAGRRMPYHTLRRVVLRVAERAGLNGQLTPHALRRSCASELVRGNANLYHVSRLLGHESLDTLRHYVKLHISDIRKTHQQTHPRERDERQRGRDSATDCP